MKLPVLLALLLCEETTSGGYYNKQIFDHKQIKKHQANFENGGFEQKSRPPKYLSG